MKKSGIMLAILAAFAVSAVLASAASAATIWLVSGAAPAAKEAVNVVGEVTLTESKNKIAIKCKEVQADNAGTIGPGAADEVTKIELLECKSGVCSTATITIDNLPWKTELVLEGAVNKDLILSSGKGVPGWNADCVILGVLVEVLCEAILPNGVEDYATTLSNRENGSVDVEFLATEEGKCNNGSVGTVAGLVELLTVSGLALAVSEV